MQIIDTHLHLVFKDRFTYPWLAAWPAIDRTWTPETYFAEAMPLGIVGALHMEVDVAEADRLAETRHVLRLDVPVLGAIAAVRPERKDCAAEMEALAGLAGVRGVRRILHLMADDSWLTSLFERNVARLGAYGLSFDLCLRADQLGEAARLADAAPDTQFVLDHCGIPDIAGGAFEPWARGIDALARRGNVAAKVSGIVAYGGPDWSAQTLRPYVERVISAFGWDRVVWGSDHPVCRRHADLTRWVEATRTLLQDCGESEVRRLLHDNACALYGLDPPSRHRGLRS